MLFTPGLMREEEFLRSPSVFEYVGLDGEPHSLPLDVGTLAFTYCQVPIVYRLGDSPVIKVTEANDTTRSIPGSRLDRVSSQSIFFRKSEVTLVEVMLDRSSVTG